MKPDTYDEVVAERDAFRESQMVFLSSLNKAFGYTVGGPTAPCEFLEEVASVLAERNTARAEVARLRGLVHEVCSCGTEQDDPRVGYMIVQIDKGLWGDLKAALDTPAREGGA